MTALKNDSFIRALLRQPTPHTPVWIMRQAGRYLPEYNETRRRAGSFLDLAKNPDYATEVTLQPLARFPLDAAILFSDILTIPDAMGLGLYFAEGEGPKFERPLREEWEIRNLSVPDPGEHLRYVLDAVTQIRHALDGSVQLTHNLPVRGIRYYRTFFFLPSIAPTVANAMVFLWLLNPEIGLINGMLKGIGIEGPAWLESTTWAPRSLILMSLWSIGGSMVIYLAGLKDIPAYLYEAAIIDGAGPLHRLRHITLPMLTPVIFFNLVMGVIGAFQYFTEAYVMTQGGPEDSTLFYALYLFRRAWQYLDMGYASAMAWVLFLIVMALTGFLFRTQRRWVHYGD